MIKFLRRIRRKLMNEGNLKKYLIYAMGEILLVVIGILIALQVNNWNQNRLNSKEEKQHLQAISDKMQLNRFQYEFGIKRYNEVIAAAEQLLMFMNNPSTVPSVELIEQNIHKLSKRFLTGRANATSIYDELIGAGQLSLISSQDLRSKLTSLKANLQLLESYEELQNNFVDNHLSPFLNQHIDRMPVSARGAKTDSSGYDKLLAIDYSAFNRSEITVSYDDLLEDKTFSNLLLELINHTKTLLPIYHRLGNNIRVIDSLAMDGNPSLQRKPFTPFEDIK